MRQLQLGCSSPQCSTFSATGDSDDSAAESGTGGLHCPAGRSAVPLGSLSLETPPCPQLCKPGGAGASSPAHTWPLVTVPPARPTPPTPLPGSQLVTLKRVSVGCQVTLSLLKCVSSCCHKGSGVGTFGFLPLLNGLAKCTILRNSRMDAADMGMRWWAHLGLTAGASTWKILERAFGEAVQLRG